MLLDYLRGDDYNNKRTATCASDGKSGIYANFRNTCFGDWILFKIDCENTNEIDSIDIGTFGDSNLCENVADTTMNIYINVTFEDGTIIVDTVSFFTFDANIWNVTIDDFVLFESGDLQIISVDKDVMTLLHIIAEKW